MRQRVAFLPFPLAGEGGAKRRMRGRVAKLNRLSDSLNCPLIRHGASRPATILRKGEEKNMECCHDPR